MIEGLILTALLSGQIYASEISTECRGDLSMIVTGLISDDGQIKFDLDNNGDTFKPRVGGPAAFMKGKSPIKERTAVYLFRDVPCGEYAVKLYHDANMNEDLDKNFLNIPTEKYGFSNCKGCLLPPSFEKAKFKFDKEHSSIKIEL